MTLPMILLASLPIVVLLVASVFRLNTILAGLIAAVLAILLSLFTFEAIYSWWVLPLVKG
jgi:hypothetical protein